MCLPLHPPDTLFYVFEADFRLNEYDCLVDPFVLPQWVDPAYEGGTEELQSVRGTTYQRSMVHDQRPKTHNDQGSMFLNHVTQFVTACHRAGYGELVWLGWNSVSDHSEKLGFSMKGSKKRRQTPHWGNQLISYTRGAAQYILDNWSGAISVPTFFDGALRRWLVNEGHAERIKASYAYPAFGGFKVHISSNTPHNAVLCPWNNPDRQGGTYARPGTEDQQRSIGKFQQKGSTWLGEAVNLPSEDLIWRTWDERGDFAAAGDTQSASAASSSASGGPGGSSMVGTKRHFQPPQTKRQNMALRKINLQKGLRRYVQSKELVSCWGF